MAYVKSYKELIVWQKSVGLVTLVYKTTNSFPKSEMFGITNQIRRAVVSIPSNIAEGYGRQSIKEYLRFYSIAYGSALELETQLIISKELLFLKENDFNEIMSLLEEVLKMLNTMRSKMKIIKLKD